jgi:hypothetical protein
MGPIIAASRRLSAFQINLLNIAKLKPMSLQGKALFGNGPYGIAVVGINLDTVASAVSITFQTEGLGIVFYCVRQNCGMITRLHTFTQNVTLSCSWTVNGTFIARLVIYTSNITIRSVVVTVGTVNLHTPGLLGPRNGVTVGINR